MSVATHAGMTGAEILTTLTAATEAGEANGSPVNQNSTDTVTYAVDFSSLKAGGDILSAPVVAIWSINGNAAVSNGAVVVAGPTVVGSQVQVSLANLTAPGLYRVAITATLNTDKTVSSYFRVWCPF